MTARDEFREDEWRMYEASSTPEKIKEILKRDFPEQYETFFDSIDITEVKFEGISIEELVKLEEDAAESEDKKSLDIREKRKRYAVLSNWDYLLIQSDSLDSTEISSLEYQKRLTSVDLDAILLDTLGHIDKDNLEQVTEKISSLESKLEATLYKHLIKRWTDWYISSRINLGSYILPTKEDAEDQLINRLNLSDYVGWISVESVNEDTEYWHNESRNYLVRLQGIAHALENQHLPEKESIERKIEGARAYLNFLLKKTIVGTNLISTSMYDLLSEFIRPLEKKLSIPSVDDWEFSD
jgi:hypothetical protein